jgi:hypothetical protein
MSVSHPKFLPAVWILLALIILAADYLFGPFVACTTLFIVPTALAAHYSGWRWAVAIGLTLPIVHLGFTLLWPAPWGVEDSIVNALLRCSVLGGFGLLIDRVTFQQREIRRLRGLLPICSFCKRIRTKEDQWVAIERYISERSEAKFSHGFCPECGQIHYGEFFPMKDQPPPQPRT